MRRLLLFGVVFFCGFILWQEWTIFTTSHTSSASAAGAASASSTTVPMGPVATIKQDDWVPVIQADSSLIKVKTDVLEASIDPKGGRIVNVDLMKYKQQIGKPTPVVLLNKNPDRLFVAGFGVSGDEELVFTSKEKIFELTKEDKESVVVLNAVDKHNRHIQKRYRFKPQSYVIETQTLLSNPKQAPKWQGNFYTHLGGQSMTRLLPPNGLWETITYQWHGLWGSRTPSPQEFVPGQMGERAPGIFGMRTYIGAAYHSDKKPYVKLPYASMAKSDLSETEPGGWIAIQNHYFISAWVPDAQSDTFSLYSRWQDGFLEHQSDTYEQSFLLGYKGPLQTVSPGKQALASDKLYVGPEIAKNLVGLGPGLDLTIDYGWLWFVSSALFWVLSKIHDVVPNWGLAIILVTILVKLAFYKLSASAYRSMAKTRKLQPRVQSIQKRFADDPAQRNQAMMELYRKEKVNPVGGCLPMIIQMPVILGLYYVFMESIELRHASFLWIHDLSTKDPYYILPLLMGATMWLQQQLNPAPPDPAQAKMMNILPVFMTLMFSQFPAGLVLYWLTQNVISFAQQWFITKEAGIEPLKFKRA